MIPATAAETPEINERLWEAWVAKNNELDRRGRAQKLWFFIILLAAATVVLIYTR
jgi:hypothetical protein